MRDVVLRELAPGRDVSDRKHHDAHRTYEIEVQEVHPITVVNDCRVGGAVRVVEDVVDGGEDERGFGSVLRGRRSVVGRSAVGWGVGMSAVDHCNGKQRWSSACKRWLVGEEDKVKRMRD